MGEKHHVRFEPVGIEIEVDSDQTILRAAAEQGVALMHGCKEGQCASCKSFVLDGEDIELDSYSTFALPEFEKDEGLTLLCRAHAYEDLTIELLHYDEDMIRSGLPIIGAVAEVLSKDPVTHDMRHLVLKLIEPADVKFFPGQYMDIEVPGSGATRSFSMANTSARDGGQLEFVIKVYPDGLFSHFLDTTLQVGDRLNISGPYGVFTLREGEDADLIFVGQPIDREVLAELSLDEVGSLQLLPPVTIRFDLVDEDSALLTPMPAQIALTVSLQIQSSDPTSAFHRILPDRGVHGATVPFDVARKSNVHRY